MRIVSLQLTRYTWGNKWEAGREVNWLTRPLLIVNIVM